MLIPILPMMSDEDGGLFAGKITFDGLVPRMVGDRKKVEMVKVKAGTSSEERGIVLIIDVKGLQRGNLDDVVLKRLKMRGRTTWFMTTIENADDLFDAFNTDAETVLVPSHTVRSEEDLEDILSVSDSAIPVILVRKRTAVLFGEDMDYRKAAETILRMGFTAVAVIDLDDSVTEDGWNHLKDMGEIIPCSMTGTIEGERFEELGFARCLKVLG